MRKTQRPDFTRAVYARFLPRRARKKGAPAFMQPGRWILTARGRRHAARSSSYRR